MKICYIKTGGTISSDYSQGVIEKGKTDFVLPLMGKDVIVKEPYCILSENADFFRLEALAKAVEEALSEADAVVIAHGTDTLSCSANAIGAVFGGCDKPIVFVSSAYPPSHEKSNARENIEGALVFLKSNPRGGVYVSYKNGGEPCCIHYASLLLAPRDFDGYIASAMNLVCGYVCSIEFIPRFDYAPQRVKGIKENLFSGKIKKVKFANAYLGLDYASLAGKEDVLICGYHSGTVNSEGGDNINSLCLKTKGRVYIVGGVAGIKYESLVHLDENITVWDNITPLTAYYILSLSDEPQKAYNALKF